MNIKQAKEEIIRTVRAYTAKDSSGCYKIPSSRQRPILLIGPPGIGKTAVMEQAARACGVGFVSYTITHHTRQSAINSHFFVKIFDNYIPKEENTDDDIDSRLENFDSENLHYSSEPSTNSSAEQTTEAVSETAAATADSNNGEQE